MAIGRTNSSGVEKYTHPSYTAKSSGLYKVTVDASGHVSAATAVTKSDITALGIPAEDTNTTYSAATQSVAGLMSAADKTKLDSVATGANAYTHPSYTAKSSGLYKVTVDASGHVSGTSAVAKSDITGLGIPGSDTNTTYDLAASASSSNGNVKLNLTAGGSGSGTDSVTIKGSGATTVTTDANGVVTINSTDTNTTYSAMTGATSSAAGTSGLVPAPAAGKQSSFLRGDGTWVVPTDTKYTHPTTSGNKHIPSGGSSGQILRWSADGTAVWGDDNNTTYTHPSYTARTGKPTANATPGFGGTFTVSQITSDATGHVTGATDRTITIPSTEASASAAGLVSTGAQTFAGAKTFNGDVSVANLVPTTSGSGTVGTASSAWLNTYSRQYRVQNPNNTNIGALASSTTGTTSAVGVCRLTLGNSIASGSANNAKGEARIYGEGAYYHSVVSAATANRTLTLPNKTGTLATTDDITTAIGNAIAASY